MEDQVSPQHLLSGWNEFKGASYNPRKVLLPDVILDWFVKVFVQQLQDWSQTTVDHCHFDHTLLQVSFPLTLFRYVNSHNSTGGTETYGLGS